MSSALAHTRPLVAEKTQKATPVQATLLPGKLHKPIQLWQPARDLPCNLGQGSSGDVESELLQKRAGLGAAWPTDAAQGIMMGWASRGLCWK